MRYYRPIDIATELKVSTSALRHYEAYELIPLPKRSGANYRLYTDLHFAYFRAIRACSIGFSFALTIEVIQAIKAGAIDKALWKVNGEQAQLHHEKKVTEQTLDLLRDSSFTIKDKNKWKSHMTIGEAAKLTNVQTSAIRHWEKEGLLKAERHPDNGYRMFTPMHIRQILIIRSMRETVYFLEEMKEIVQAVEQHSVDAAERATKRALERLNKRNQLQFSAIKELVNLLEVIETE